MNKLKFKEQMRKIRWATEKATGKKMGKKGLIEAQKVAMQMQGVEQEQPKPKFSTWRGNTTKQEPEKMSVDLTKIIGKKFASAG